MNNRKMTPEDERFHYFTIVDLNQDSCLDGVEVWKVLLKFKFPSELNCASSRPSITATNPVFRNPDRILKSKKLSTVL